MLNDCSFCHKTNSILYRNSQQMRSDKTCNINKCKECGLYYSNPRMDEFEFLNYLEGLETDRNKDKLEYPAISAKRNDWSYSRKKMRYNNA